MKLEVEEKKKIWKREVPKGEDNMAKGMLVFGCITYYFVLYNLPLPLD